MADYFDELNCEPIPEHETQNHQTMLMIRFMQQNGFFPEEFEAEITAPPASKEVVKNLQERQIGKDDEKCSICLKPNEDNDDTDPAANLFKVLPCLHEFHATCILPWLEKVIKNINFKKL